MRHVKYGGRSDPARLDHPKGPSKNLAPLHGFGLGLSHGMTFPEIAKRIPMRV